LQGEDDMSSFGDTSAGAVAEIVES